MCRGQKLKETRQLVIWAWREKQIKEISHPFRPEMKENEGGMPKRLETGGMETSSDALNREI